MPGYTQVLDFTTLDVFTSTPFAGNPLAIITLPSKSTITQEQKQLIAREFNYSETVFVSKRDESESSQPGDGSATQSEYDVAIFTTDAEIPFAGHPTIGTSCFLLSQFDTDTQTTLHVKAGPIHVHYDAPTRLASAQIPQAYHLHANRLPAAALVAYQPALAPFLRDTGKASTKTYPIASIVKGMTFVLIDLDSLDELEAVSVSAASLPEEIKLDTHDGWDQGLVALYFYVLESQDLQESRFMLRTRMLEPGVEDPATGSAASTLACYLAKAAWARRNPNMATKSSFQMVQGVEMGRKSDIGLEVTLGADGEVSEVVLKGEAITVSEGTLRV